ncbi:MAG: hypothetical protein ACXABG_04540 [Promethearchaeota archaeon]
MSKKQTIIIINLSIYIHNERINSKLKTKDYESTSIIEVVVSKEKKDKLRKKVKIARLST